MSRDDSPAKSAGASLHIAGGATLHVLQGPQIARRRLEAVHEATEAYATFTQPPGRPVFVNPLLVKYIRQAQSSNREARRANARIHFIDGSAVDVLQGSGIVNKRLSEARASLSLFATFADPTASQVFVNCTAVTHLTAEPDAAERSDDAPQAGKARARQS